MESIGCPAPLCDAIPFAVNVTKVTNEPDLEIYYYRCSECGHEFQYQYPDNSII
jgi:hypothetical protein